MTFFSKQITIIFANFFFYCSQALHLHYKFCYLININKKQWNMMVTLLYYMQYYQRIISEISNCNTISGLLNEIHLSTVRQKISVYFCLCMLWNGTLKKKGCKLNTLFSCLWLLKSWTSFWWTHNWIKKFQNAIFFKIFKIPSNG